MRKRGAWRWSAPSTVSVLCQAVETGGSTLVP